jgi:hypothetical protein
MATISANALGVYVIDYGASVNSASFSGTLADYNDSTEPIEVVVKAGDFFEYPDGVFTGVWPVSASSTVSGRIYILLDSLGNFAEIALGAGNDSVLSFSEQPVEIMAAATSLSVEASNTVNETVAHNGTGGSTTYIVGGAMSWSMSIDGLIDLSAAGVGSSVSIMDAARAKKYIITRFHTGTDVNYVGQALIDNVSMSGGVDDIATYSASFSGYGDLYKQV